MARQNLIQRKSSEYEYNQDIIHELEQACLNNNMDDMCFNEVSPECEHQQEIDRNIGETISQQYGCFDPGQNAPVYDVGLDIGITRKQVEDDITQWGELEDDAYREMIRGLNEQQKHFMYHVLHKL